jgi:membrane protease subunit HflK
MYGDGNRRPEFDPEQFLRNVKQSWASFKSRLPVGGNIGLPALLFLGLAALVWLGTGFYTVGPSEQAALRLFGEFRGTEGTGLHWYPPAPIGTRNIEAVQETKTLELGFRSDPARDIQIESQMITGDLNIVDTQLVVQYRISDLGAFLFNVDDPGDPDADPREGRPDGRTLRDATEAALRQIVGQRSIDDPLRVAKTEVQDETAQLLRDILDGYNAGIEILSVQLQTVRPPDIVRDAFDDVNRARVDKESRINESLAYEQDQLPRARGAAQQVEQAAAAFKSARIARATGEAAEFTAVLQEYQNSRAVTRERLYLEAMEEILPSISIFIIDENAGGVLPFLPLTGGAMQIPGTTGGGQ